MKRNLYRDGITLKARYPWGIYMDYSEDALDEARHTAVDLREHKVGEEHWAKFLGMKEANERMTERLRELKRLVRTYEPKDHEVTFQLIREQLGL